MAYDACYLFIYLFLLCSNGFVLKIWRAKTATRATDWLFFFSFTIFHSINVIMVTHIHYLIFKCHTIATEGTTNNEDFSACSPKTPLPHGIDTLIFYIYTEYLMLRYTTTNYNDVNNHVFDRTLHH